MEEAALPELQVQSKEEVEEENKNADRVVVGEIVENVKVIEGIVKEREINDNQENVKDCDCDEKQENSSENRTVSDVQADNSKHYQSPVQRSPTEIDRITNFKSSSSSSCSSRSCSRERSPSVVVVQRLSDESPTEKPPEFPQNSVVSCEAETASPNFKHSDGEMYFNTMGPRYKIVWEGDLQVCYLNHTRTVISKILSSKFLRRWESHRLYLNDSCISSKTPTGCLEMSIPYTALQEVYVVSRWDAGHKFCIRLVISDGSLLLQASNAYTRDQWYHSIMWKKNIFKYQNLLKISTRPEVILKELKNLVELATTTPLRDECVSHVPIEIVSKLLVEDEDCWTVKSWSMDMISILAPLLENCPPSPEMCRFFSRHCINHPRSSLVSDALTPIIHRILKHNVDFGKFLLTRKLVQDYIQALYSHNDGRDVIRKFVASTHGQNCGCPHPRVLPNLVSVCLAAIFSAFEVQNILQSRNESSNDRDKPSQLECYLHVFIAISEYDDWRPGLAQLLQPVPFPDDALANEDLIRYLMPVIRKVGTDMQCDIHQTVLGVREGKEGWFDIYCPSSLACVDEGKLWGDMLDTLLKCCCKRKRFIGQLIGKRLGACLLLSLRDHSAAQNALCLALEWNLLSEADQRLTVVTTLQSTPSGSQFYSALCQRQLHLQELQQKGGPRKLTLPSRSTDSDVIRLLSCGAFGNLECLSLAFTHVTSACAEHIIKLPALRYLNLWATQFGDAGLMVISEHLPKLQVLNLCETPVSDKGIAALVAMTNLRKLNLNSTKLSAETFETLKKKLPGLQELDVRYTEAW